MAHNGSAVFHHTKLGPGAVENTPCVDSHDKFPILVCFFDDGVHPDYSSPVRSSIELSKLLNGLLNPGVHRSTVSHINANRNVRVWVVKRFDGLGKTLLIDICQREISTSLGQHLSDGTALAGGCSGNGNLARSV